MRTWTIGIAIQRGGREVFAGVTPDSFTLQADDVVEISISGVGTLRNPVAVV